MATEAPCVACLAHEDLEERIDDMSKLNRIEHQEMMKTVETLIADIKWMNVIGKWILASLFGYFVALGYYILSIELPTKDEMSKLAKHVDKVVEASENNSKTLIKLSTKISILEDLFVRKGGK